MGFFFLVDVWLLHIMEARDIMGRLRTATNIGLPITATDINRHITEIKATLEAILILIGGIDIWMEGIDTVDISTSTEAMNTLGAGINIPAEDIIGEEAIEAAIIVD